MLKNYWLLPVKKRKNDAEYTRLIAEGDASVKITKFAEVLPALNLP